MEQAKLVPIKRDLIFAYLGMIRTTTYDGRYLSMVDRYPFPKISLESEKTIADNEKIILSKFINANTKSIRLGIGGGYFRAFRRYFWAIDSNGVRRILYSDI